jgi:hypothetical protein
MGHEKAKCFLRDSLLRETDVESLPAKETRDVADPQRKA